MSSNARNVAAGRELVVVGLSHHTAPVAVRERLAAACADAPAFLRGLGGLPGVHEVVLVSTCNRVEVTACCSPGTGPAEGIAAFVADAGGIEAGQRDALVFLLRGRDAVRHVFRVASSLDSMVVGEPPLKLKA